MTRVKLAQKLWDEGYRVDIPCDGDIWYYSQLKPYILINGNKSYTTGPYWEIASKEFVYSYIVECFKKDIKELINE